MSIKHREGTPDCTLEFDYVEIVPRVQVSRPRRGLPSIQHPHHTYPAMWRGRQEGLEAPKNAVELKQAEIRPITIENKSPKTSDPEYVVELFASVLLDRETDAKEFHKVRFTKEQWNRLATAVRMDETVILEGCRIEFDDKDDEVIVNTETHYDYGDGLFGFTTGIFKRYIPGVVIDARSVKIVRTVCLSEPATGADAEAQAKDDRPMLDTFELIRYYQSAPSDPIYEDDYEDGSDLPPPLSDYSGLSEDYDDLEELELNTRGDGYS